MFQGDAGDYFCKRFRELGGWSPALSKKIGWREMTEPKYPETEPEDIMPLWDVAVALFPHALDWRECVYKSNVDQRGVVHGQENRDELAALDAFIATMRKLGTGED